MVQPSPCSKGWIYGGVYHPDWILGTAVADAGYTGTAFSYFFHRASGVLIEESVIRPWGFRSGFVPFLQAAWALAGWNVVPEADAWKFIFSGNKLQMSFTVQHAHPGITAIAPLSDRRDRFTRRSSWRCSCFRNRYVSDCML